MYNIMDIIMYISISIFTSLIAYYIVYIDKAL